MALKQQKLIAVDIGSSTIKMVQSNGKGKISKMVTTKLPEGVVINMKILAPDILSDTLKTAKRQGKLSGSRCVLCISGSNIIIRHIIMPMMSEEQIYQNVLSEIATYLPIDTSKYSIDYSVQEIKHEGRISQLRVMVVAVPKDLVNSYISALNKAGLKPVRIDILENCIEKLFRAVSKSLETPLINFGVIDIGSITTNISTYANGKYFVNKVITVGGSTLNKDIVEALEIDAVNSEELKISSNTLIDEYSNRELAPIVRGVIDKIIYDAVRVFEYFKSRNNQTSIDKVFLCGGSSKLKGLSSYVEDNLHIETVSINEIVKLLIEQKSSEETDYEQYAAAIGATYREVK